MPKIPSAGPRSAAPARPAPPAGRPRVGDEVTLTVEAFGDRGKGVARMPLPGDDGDGRGYVVFVPGGVPGDTIAARIAKRRRGHAEAVPLRLLRASRLRVDPRCRYADVCGGCSWQHVTYEAQLEMKRDGVARALAHAPRDGGGTLDLLARPDGTRAEVRPTLGADRPEGSGGVYLYRNKMEFSFSAQRWLTDDEIATGETVDRYFALGLHVPGRFDKVLDLRECHLQSEWSARLVNGLREFARARGWEPWHVREHAGFLRHLVIRQAARTDDRMVNLVTWARDDARMAELGDWLRAEFPETTTLVNTVNEGLANTSYGETHTVFGPGIVRDRIGRFTFDVAPQAFFQTNTVQAEKLYEVARDLARVQPTDTLYDLYCGAGTISLFLSDHVARVVGVELVEEAVANARSTAAAHGVENATFVAGDMLKLFTPGFVAAHGRPDVLVVDPPRAGMHPRVVEQIAALRPERLVYVSCNPRTQAADLVRLQDATGGAYRVEAVQPVDLFPHTTHAECVIGLRAS